MTEFKLDKVNALKLMLDGKKVIGNDDFIYQFKFNMIFKKYLASEYLISVEKFLASGEALFKEYEHIKMNKENLLDALDKLKRWESSGSVCKTAIELLIEYIDDIEIEESFKHVLEQLKHKDL